MSDSPHATLEKPVASVAENGAVAAVAEIDLGYHVTLDSFSGPLDLLLFLVRRTEVDLADIPVATIADQFIAMLTATPDLDLDVAGDFILMAATLLELKSRLVVPPDEPAENTVENQDDDIIDARSGLIRQLMAYRRFKEATQLLPGLEEAQHERLARRLHEIIPDDPAELDGLDLENCNVGLLYETWEQVLISLSRLGPRTVLNDDVPLERKINALVDALRAAREGKLSAMFARETTVSGRVGVLMATLECARQRFVEALQHEQFGDVLLRYREDQERAPTSGELPPEPVEETKKRRRRLPLVTWHPPERAAQPEQQELDLDLPDEDGVIETDEQRFHRELEETCAVEAVLQRTADLEASFATFQTQQQLDAELVKQPLVQHIEPVVIAETPHSSIESVTLQTGIISDETAPAVTSQPREHKPICP